MDLTKNMELFVVAIVAVVAAASLNRANAPQAGSAPTPVVASASADAPAATHVVYVSARRLSTEEKAVL